MNASELYSTNDEYVTIERTMTLTSRRTVKRSELEQIAQAHGVEDETLEDFVAEILESDADSALNYSWLERVEDITSDCTIVRGALQYEVIGSEDDSLYL